MKKKNFSLKQNKVSQDRKSLESILEMENLQCARRKIVKAMGLYM